MKVTLKANHTHAGVSYQAGATVDVSVHDALWLKAADLIDEGLDAIKAELKKLASRDNPTPHAAALATAETAVAAKAPTNAAPASAAAPAASTLTAAKD